MEKKKRRVAKEETRNSGAQKLMKDDKASVQKRLQLQCSWFDVLFFFFFDHAHATTSYSRCSSLNAVAEVFVVVTRKKVQMEQRTERASNTQYR